MAHLAHHSRENTNIPGHVSQFQTMCILMTSSKLKVTLRTLLLERKAAAYIRGHNQSFLRHEGDM